VCWRPAGESPFYHHRHRPPMGRPLPLGSGREVTLGVQSGLGPVFPLAGSCGIPRCFLFGMGRGGTRRRRMGRGGIGRGVGVIRQVGVFLRASPLFPPACATRA
jgi:hypothetical protein